MLLDELLDKMGDNLILTTSAVSAPAAAPLFGTLPHEIAIAALVALLIVVRVGLEWCWHWHKRRKLTRARELAEMGELAQSRFKSRHAP